MAEVLVRVILGVGVFLKEVRTVSPFGTENDSFDITNDIIEQLKTSSNTTRMVIECISRR